MKILIAVFTHTVFSTAFEVALHVTFALTAVYVMLTAVALIVRRRHTPQVPVEDGSCPNVTIQIPTYNELAAIQCATRCINFDYPHEKYEILIGDDSSRPDISARLDAFARENPRVKIIRRQKNIGYKPGNLNHMLPHSHGDYILIFDSDFLPERDFLRRIVAPVVADPSLAGVQARWSVINPMQNNASIMGSSIVYIIHAIILPFLNKFCGSSVFCGSAELVRRNLLEKNGGWREGAMTEDIDYSFRLLKQNHHIYYLEDLNCDCEVPQTAKDLFRQQMRWAYGVTRSFIDHGKDLFFNATVSVKTKITALLFGSGYVMTALLLVMLFLGLANTVSAIAAADYLPATTWQETVFDTVRSIALSSGLMLAILCAGIVSGFRSMVLVRLVFASYTIGFILVFSVVRGVVSAMIGRPMQWFMLKKTGNNITLATTVVNAG